LHILAKTKELRTEGENLPLPPKAQGIEWFFFLVECLSSNYALRSEYVKHMGVVLKRFKVSDLNT